MSEQDYELLSNYIDGALDEADRTALEARLAQEAELRRELAAMRQTVMLVRNLPTLKAPRDFTLTPAMVRRPSRLLVLLPAISAAAAMLLLVLGGTLLFNQGATQSNQPVAFAATNTVAALRAFTTSTDADIVVTEDPAASIMMVAPAAVTGDAFDDSAAGEDALSRTMTTDEEQAGGMSNLAQATSLATEVIEAETMMQMDAVEESAPTDELTTPSTKTGEALGGAPAAPLNSPAPEFLLQETAVAEQGQLEMFSFAATDEAGDSDAVVLEQPLETDETEMREREEPLSEPSSQRLAVPLLVGGFMLTLVTVVIIWRLRE